MPAAPPLDSSRINRALLALWVIFWVLMIVVAVEDNRGDEGIRWWEPFVWEGSSAIVATFWLWLSRRARVRWSPLLDEPARWFGRHLVWLPVVAVSFVVGIYGIRHGVYALTTETYEHEPYAYLFVYETLKVLLYASLWICIVFGLESFTRWQREREQLLTLQKDLAESQLAQLRAQLQPHFLFNALNTISSLMQVDVARADKLLTQLADLLRASLHTGAQQMTSLRQEIELLKLYSAIMQERFAGRVALEWSIADDALDADVPAMLAQPLLENAFKHGVERSTTPVAVRVSARREADRVEIVIRNGGNVGARANNPPSAGIGLANCRERLALIYGEAATLELTQDGGDVVARVSLPRKRTP